MRYASEAEMYSKAKRDNLYVVSSDNRLYLTDSPDFEHDKILYSPDDDYARKAEQERQNLIDRIYRDENGFIQLQGE